MTDAVWGRDRLTVLAYHRIVDLEGDGTEFDPDVVSASPAGFERQMRFVARDFSVVALEDLHESLATGRPLPERPLLITFDDGYRDNHAHAFPVLRGMGLPAVVFIITGAIGTDRVMWWDELAFLLGRTERDAAELPLAGPRDLSTPAARREARAEMLRRLKAVPDGRRARAMDELRDVLEVPPPAPPAPLFMGWEQVRELVANGVECQPHTHDHPLMIRVDPVRARDEVERSAAIVRERTGRPALAFAYPNGDYDASTIRALRDAGIAMAFTMRLGPARPEAVRRAPFEIARVPLDASDTWDLFRLKVSGGLSAIFRARSWRPGRRAEPAG